MIPSLRAFMETLIDYAGLFPPAQLPVLESIQNYARYRQEADCWMLGRFIVPAQRLDELTAVGSAILALPLATAGEPFAFSIIGSSGADSVNLDADAIRRFVEQHGEQVKPEVFEVAIPADISGDPFETLLTDIKQSLAAVGITRLFAEVIPTTRNLITLAEHRVGFKLRCGGKTVPTPEEVTQAILACRDYGLPMKFTAGMHQPLRHFDPATNTPAHGFFNIFGAGLLANQLSPHDLEQLVTDTDAAHFVFDERGFSWRNHTVTTEDIKQQRQTFLLSVGSCSFDEPREALRVLNLL